MPLSAAKIRRSKRQNEKHFGVYYIYWGEDDAKAFEYIKRAADLGDTESQLKAGYMYENGVGVGQDYEKAAEYYRKSAEQGFDQAFYNLGILSIDGYGLKQSYENGIRYLSQSALMGFDGAYEVLGELYRDGEGVEKDDNKAADFFNKAAGMENEEAKKSYEDMISDGRIPKDYKPSEPLPEMDPDKLCELGQEALGKEDNETAYCCFLCASALGSEKDVMNWEI